MLGSSRKKNRDRSSNGFDVSKEAQFRRREVRTEKGHGAFAYPSQSAPKKVSSIPKIKNVIHYFQSWVWNCFNIILFIVFNWNSTVLSFEKCFLVSCKIKYYSYAPDAIEKGNTIIFISFVHCSKKCICNSILQY